MERGAGSKPLLQMRRGGREVSWGVTRFWGFHGLTLWPLEKAAAKGSRLSSGPLHRPEFQRCLLLRVLVLICKTKARRTVESVVDRTEFQLLAVTMNSVFLEENFVPCIPGILWGTRTASTKGCSQEAS